MYRVNGHILHLLDHERAQVGAHGAVAAAGGAAFKDLRHAYAGELAVVHRGIDIRQIRAGFADLNRL